MKLLHVTAIPVTALRFVVPVTERLQELGYEVELACGPGRGLGALEVAAGCAVHRTPISRRMLAVRNVHAVGALRRLLKTEGYDVVHAHTPAAAGVVRLAARATGVQIAYTMHGSLWGEGVPGWQRLAFTALERSLGRADLVLTVNPEDAADCVRRLNLTAGRVKVLPAGGAGVGPRFFMDAATREELGRRTRRRIGLMPEHRVVAYVGRTVAAKGLGTLATAFSQVAAELDAARLLVVGGPLEGDRDPYTRERFLSEMAGTATGRLIWVGFQDDVAPYLAAADVVTLPSRREGFGMTLAEGAALGRPAAATDTRGARAVIVPSESGFLSPIDDAAGLATNLVNLLRDDELRAWVGEAARLRAQERFTRSRVVAAYQAAYSQLEP